MMCVDTRKIYHILISYVSLYYVFLYDISFMVFIQLALYGKMTETDIVKLEPI